MRCAKTGKVKHMTQAGAAIAAKKISKIAMNTYICKHCHRWHVGHGNDPCRRAARITELLDNYEKARARRAS